jgi:hypothetical protein
MAQKALQSGEWLVSDPITSADANTTKVCLDIPAKTLVTEVLCIVTTVLAGGTPSIDVGDGDDADSWVDTLDITETTAGAYRGSATNSPYSITGKYYPTGGQIKAVVATGLTSGSAVVAARVLRLADTL